MPFDLMLPFIVASALLALAPGPDNIFVLTQSAVGGRKDGIVITLGLCTGLFFHTGLVAFGVAIIFQQSALAFNALKIVGAIYLVYLAWQMLRSSAETLNEPTRHPSQLRKLYLRGIIMNVTNPKVSLFFLAFLPQFASIDRGPLLPQIVILGLIFMLVALVIFSAIALTAGFISERLKRSSRAQTLLNNTAAAVFVALAIKLVLTER